MESLELNSRSFFLWNNDLGIEVAGLEADTLTPVASMTKIMTALLTLENLDLNKEITITTKMLQGLEGYAVVGLSVGQKVTARDLLYATMLPSAGDAAQALAIEISGSIDEFADLMNARAAEIGMQNTQFSNPVGMDEGNYSTPREIAMLLREALKNPEFVTVFNDFEEYLPSLGKTVKKTFNQIPYVTGGKTGYTEAAGRCLASVAEVEGTEYILVTVGAPLGKNVVDAQTVYDAVAAEYGPVQILAEGEKILQIGVAQSTTKVMDFVVARDVVVALPNDMRAEDLTYNYNGIEEITPQTELGATLGTVRVSRGEDLLYTQEIIYDEMPEFYNYGWVVAGGGVSLVLLLSTLVLIWRALKWKRSKKHGWLWPVVTGALCVASVIVNLLVFGKWFAEPGVTEVIRPEEIMAVEVESSPEKEPESETMEPELTEETEETEVVADSKVTGNCTTGWGNLMLINPNFTVDSDFINQRKTQLISVSQTYGITEYNVAVNGDNLLAPEAAAKLAEMVAAYEAENPGHKMGTRSCFRVKGTQCGRLCAATGTSDHHTGLTCDLIDTAYGTSLDTGDYAQHKEWQWLRANSYKYGFIDRFPEAWAGGPMTAPLNVDANGSTGLYETWHYRYVGTAAATEIATGKYNNGQYDSLEHYLKATGRIQDLKNGVCE